MDSAVQNRGRVNPGGSGTSVRGEDGLVQCSPVATRKRGRNKKRKEGAQMKSFSAAWPFEASDFLVSCIKHGGLPLNPPRGQNPISKLPRTACSKITRFALKPPTITGSSGPLFRSSWCSALRLKWNLLSDLFWDNTMIRLTEPDPPNTVGHLASGVFLSTGCWELKAAA